MAKAHAIGKWSGLSTLLILAVFSSGCGGGGSGGGIDTGASNEFGDSTFYIQEAFYGRPLFNTNGDVNNVINPKSIIEVDPITGIILKGFPKPLFPGDPLNTLASLSLGESPNTSYKVKIVPRNGAVILQFSRPVDPGCMNLGSNRLLTPASPIQIVNESGTPVTCQAYVWSNQVVLNPVTAGKIGFPPSPLLFDQNGNPISNPKGFLKIICYSAGTGIHIVKSVIGTTLSARSDLLASPMKPLGINPGNAQLDFMSYGDDSFNGFLPDISPPRIIREVNDTGTAQAGSGVMTIVDQSKNFVTAANGGLGEWAGGLLTLRPGLDEEEKVKVLSNTSDTLTLVSPGFEVPPEPGVDEYLIQRAEFFEPIPGLDDLTTAVNPSVIPKDPFDPEDQKNWELYNFAMFDEWNGANGTWDPVNYDPGPNGTNPIHPMWRISLRFSEPMDVDSFRPYETFYVCNGSVSIEDPGFGQMKPGRVTASLGNRIISFEPVLDDQIGTVGERLLGFGGQPKALRLVLRVIPPQDQIQDFYDSLGDPNNWPPGIVKDLVKEGVLGIINLGGQPIGLPAQFLQKSSPHCVAYTSSTGHGAYPPSADLKYDFATQNTSDPEYGVMVHRFMGLPETGVGPGSDPITGVIYNDHEGKIYGPHIADTSIGLNGFLSGHYVEFIEHVFDDYNHPPPSSPTYPDPIFKIPFGVGTPVTANDGCRFQHVYRVGDCSPDVPAFEDTVLDLIGLAWAPIGGWVTNTLIENMSIVIADSNIIPNTNQEAGIPNAPNSGLVSQFSSNYIANTTVMVLGKETPPASPNIGAPYVIDWRNLFGPKNQGQKFNNYISWPEFDQPEGTPGFPFTSERSMLIEYRVDYNQGSGMAMSNGFSFHAGIISSMLPRFRVYSRGDPNTHPNVLACSFPHLYPTAWGPLASPGNYGDNSRYFMIFNYVKRYSLIESPYLGAAQTVADVKFLTPLILPPLEDIPEGTALSIMFRTNPNPEQPGSPVSPWTLPGEVENLNNPPYATYDFIQFQAIFEANVQQGVVPAIDTIVIPYEADF